MTPPALALLRCFAHLTPRDEPLPAWAYVRGLMNTGHGVRMISVGGAHLIGGPWERYPQLITWPLAPRYLNVVIATPDDVMGRPIRASDVAPRLTPREVGGDLELGQISAAAARASDVVYEPQGPLETFLTAGMPNVAITLPGRPQLGAAAARALAQYDLVIVPTQAAAGELAGQLGPGIGNVSFIAPVEHELLREAIEYHLPT